jgi:putative cofactor-binding repeat protein
VTGNRITDCAYSAIRGNSASDIQILGNSCARLGEVALYAEFAFQGTLIANNLVDTAATGISVTNFNEGGRLAVVQGNILRNLFRREQEPEDKRGEGIAVEADSSVIGNVIESAPTGGPRNRLRHLPARHRGDGEPDPQGTGRHTRVRVRRRHLPHRQQHDLGRDGGEHPRHGPGDAADWS